MGEKSGLIHSLAHLFDRADIITCDTHFIQGRSIRAMMNASLQRASDDRPQSDLLSVRAHIGQLYPMKTKS